MWAGGCGHIRVYGEALPGGVTGVAGAGGRWSRQGVSTARSIASSACTRGCVCIVPAYGG